MIQLAVATSAVTTVLSPATGDPALAEQPGNASESAPFAALLAVEQGKAGASQTQAEALISLLTPATPSSGEPATPGLALPRPGKDLPLADKALPLALTLMLPVVKGEPRPVAHEARGIRSDDPAPAGSEDQPAPMRLAIPALPPAFLPAPPAPPVFTPTPEASSTTAMPALVTAQMMGQPLTRALADPDAPKAAPAPTAAPNPVGPEAIRMLPVAAMPTPLDPAALALSSQAAPASAQTQAPAALPAAQPGQTPIAPAAPVRLRPVIAGTREKPGAPRASEPASPTPLLAAVTPDMAVAPASAPTPSPTTQPHDFASLVDRLIAARDAATSGAAQPVQVSVAHAEFGQVSLHFHHDEAGLSVSLASRDPEFARAVEAATPPIASLQQSEAARNNTGSNSGSAASQPAMTGQFDTRTGSQGQPRDDARPAAAARQPQFAESATSDPASPTSLPPRQRGRFA